MTFTRRLAALAFALTASAFAIKGAAAETITIRADPWCPYNCRPGDANPGYGIEIAKAAFEKAGHAVDYAVMPWARAVDAAREGNITAVIGASQGSEEGRGLVFPKQSIGPAGNVMALKKGNTWTYAGPASLEKLTVGAALGYSYDTEIDAYLEKNKSNVQKVQFLSGDDVATQNLKKLAAGRISGVLENNYVIAYAAKGIGIGIEAEIMTVPVGKPELVYVAFSPKNPKSAEFAKLFDDGVTALRASGALAKILEKYGVKDWN